MEQLSLTPLSCILVILRLQKVIFKKQYVRNQVDSVKNFAASEILTQHR